MKKLNITWDGIYDSTGYLFSFAKSLSCAVKNSLWSEFSEDIIASSGFAFRMWLRADLCPSATSMWEFGKQKPWVESGGFFCSYIERLWEQDNIEEKQRSEAMKMIKQSIDNGIAAVSWDIGVPEWGLIIGYDDDLQKFLTLSVTGAAEEMDYALLGKRDIPILNVLTVTGKTEKLQKDIIADTLKIAKAHLNGEEWAVQSKGLEVYTELIKHFESDDPEFASCWSMEYFLGTYAALKWYAWRFFEKYNLCELAELYKNVYENWQKAFEIKKSTDLTVKENAQKIAILLTAAHENEKTAVSLMG